MALPNYLGMAVQIGASLKPGTVNHLIVKHDDWCDQFKGKPCNCEPDLEVVAE